MNNKIAKYPILLLLIFSSVFCIGVQAQDDIVLCSGNVTNYSIYCKPTNNNAAKVLQQYLLEISGAPFEIGKERSGDQIVLVDAVSALELYPAESFPKADEEGLAIKVIGNDLVIAGSSEHDLNNAVYELLEKYLGCRYYAENAIYIPKKNRISLPADINYRYTPVIKYRYINYSEAFKGSYAAWNKLKNPSANPNTVKMPDWGLWVHSMFTLVPPDKYFKDHPEYYALINGKRTKSQLCLTNKDVLSIAIQSLAAIIKANPTVKYFSVSQMDNNDYCQCDNCKVIMQKEQSPSGVIINFVNQVAAKFPDKTISTLAYNFSRKAPEHIKPLGNVNIFFCATGVNRAVPFTADKSEGSLYYDMLEWKKKTSNIFFWDYVTDFRNLYMPFPNYETLQPNIQFLSNNKIPYAFMQGWVFASTEMSELRCWLLAQLLWNPDIDIAAARKEFLDFYYGKASIYIDKYLQSLSDAATSNTVLTNSDNPLQHAGDYFTTQKLKEYKQYFSQAITAVKNEDPVYSKRIQTAMQSLRYVILEVEAKQDADSKNDAYYVSQLDEFHSVAKIEKQDLLDEGTVKLDDYYKENGNYLKTRLVKNLAKGATAKIISPPGYMPFGGLSTLFDGILGNKQSDGKWIAFDKTYVEMVVDLGAAKSFDSISMNFIHDPVFITQLPSSVIFSVSDDGNNFKELGVAKNIWPGMGVKKEIKTFRFVCAAKVKTRYIKIAMRMVNFSMYNNLEKPQAMRCDEVIIL